MEKKVRVNEQIDVSPVRLIGGEGKQIGIVPASQAIEMAQRAGLDLVEVSPDSKPPVCRIMDYGKYKYEIAKKAKIARKNRHIIHVKEIKLRSEISEHDFDFKLNHALEFLKRKDKVKFTVVFRGREILHKDMGAELLKRITATLKDSAVVESPIRHEGPNLTMIVIAK